MWACGRTVEDWNCGVYILNCFLNVKMECGRQNPCSREAVPGPGPEELTVSEGPTGENTQEQALGQSHPSSRLLLRTSVTLLKVTKPVQQKNKDSEDYSYRKWAGNLLLGPKFEQLFLPYYLETFGDTVVIFKCVVKRGRHLKFFFKWKIKRSKMRVTLRACTYPTGLLDWLHPDRTSQTRFSLRVLILKDCPIMEV